MTPQLRSHSPKPVSQASSIMLRSHCDKPSNRGLAHVNYAVYAEHVTLLTSAFNRLTSGTCPLFRVDRPCFSNEITSAIARGWSWCCASIRERPVAVAEHQLRKALPRWPSSCRNLNTRLTATATGKRSVQRSVQRSARTAGHQLNSLSPVSQQINQYLL